MFEIQNAARNWLKYSSHLLHSLSEDRTPHLSCNIFSLQFLHIVYSIHADFSHSQMGNFYIDCLTPRLILVDSSVRNGHLQIKMGSSGKIFIWVAPN